MRRFHVPLAALAALAFAGATSTSSAACVDQINAGTDGKLILAQSASPGSQRHPGPPVTQPLQKPETQHGGSVESGTTGSGSGDTGGSGPASGDAGAGAGAGGAEAGGGAGGAASGDAGAGAGAGGSDSGGSGGGGGSSN